jgi:hypothetical protein
MGTVEDSLNYFTQEILLIQLHMAVKGNKPYFREIQKGYFHIFEHGNQVWRSSPYKVNHYIVPDFAEGVEPLKVAADFDVLLVK